jgi:signal transduction histidine kinase
LKPTSPTSKRSGRAAKAPAEPAEAPHLRLAFLPTEPPAAPAPPDPLRTLAVMQTDFVNTISHELRTPLTSILAYGEFLEDGLAGELNEQQRQFVGCIQESAERLQRLVDDLLEFVCCEGRSMRLVFRDADMGARIAAVVDALKPELTARNTTLSLDLPAEPVHLVLDPRRIGQVLQNLIGNAIKFTPPNGHVHVHMSVLPGGVYTEVRDNGIGIAERDLPRLFERFYQADSSTTRESGGAGLGLYISRAIVEAHAGQLGVESQAGHGSRFWFMLPTDPTAAIEARANDPV